VTEPDSAERSHRPRAIPHELLARHGLPLYILARPSPSPLSNPSASRRAASAENRRRDPPRRQSAAATHLGLREYSTKLLIVLATPPSLLSRDFMLSTLRATSPNFRRGRRPPSAVAGTPWSISALLLAIGEFALSSSTPQRNRFAFYRPKTPKPQAPAITGHGAARVGLSSGRPAPSPSPRSNLNRPFEIRRLKSKDTP
jgi:hypothetical protein